MCDKGDSSRVVLSPYRVKTLADAGNEDKDKDARCEAIGYSGIGIESLDDWCAFSGGSRGDRGFGSLEYGVLSFQETPHVDDDDALECCSGRKDVNDDEEYVGQSCPWL